jgi:hypothetical protein
MWDKKEFLTLEESEAWKKGEDLRSLGFCPIIDDQCYTKCVCFAPAVIKPMLGVSTLKHTVINPGCKHPMVSGYMEVEVV